MSTISVTLGAGAANKGITKRSVRDEMALRVRIINGRHVTDVIERATAEMGARGLTLGPVDMSSNTLRAYSRARAKAHLTAPYVDALTEELADTIGDHSASTTVDKYGEKGGRPMPTVLASVSHETLVFRVGCNYAATAIGWSDSLARPTLLTVTPDDLDVAFTSDNPIEPSISGRHQTRRINGKDVRVVDTYDITDRSHPTFKVMDGDADVTEKALGRKFEGDGYWWRFEDGTPFIPIVIIGDPREPFRNVNMVDATLSVCSMKTHWKAGIFDAAYPREHTIGLKLAKSDNIDGDDGHPAGPEIVYSWEHIDPDRPGTIVQHGPGFDPQKIGESIRDYATGIITAQDLHLRIESVGGEPAETERRAMLEQIAVFYPEARRHDSLVIQRAAAITNRATAMIAAAQEEGEDEPTVTATSHSEVAPGILYREEVDDLFQVAEETEVQEEEEDDGGSGDDE